jgi:hypothetical protein
MILSRRMPIATAALYVEARMIRPAMTDDIAHALDDRLLRLSFPK